MQGVHTAEVRAANCGFHCGCRCNMQFVAYMMRKQRQAQQLKKGSCKQQNLKLADGFKSFASTLTEVG